MAKDFKLHNKKNSYGVHTISKNSFMLVKNLNSYSNRNDCVDDLVKLMMKQITEEDLLQEYTKKLDMG
jgi:hypothetical protein